MKLSTFLFAGVLAAMALTAYAHEAKGPNGGKLKDVAAGHIEFTHTPGDVAIFATDEADKPLSTISATGRVVIQSGGKTTQAQLTPAEPNKLIAKLDAPLAKGAVVVVSGTVGGKAVQARFTVD